MDEKESDRGKEKESDKLNSDYEHLSMNTRDTCMKDIETIPCE